MRISWIISRACACSCRMRRSGMNRQGVCNNGKGALVLLLGALAPVICSAGILDPWQWARSDRIEVNIPWLPCNYRIPNKLNTTADRAFPIKFQCHPVSRDVIEFLFKCQDTCSLRNVVSNTRIFNSAQNFQIRRLLLEPSCANLYLNFYFLLIPKEPH